MSNNINLNTVTNRLREFLITCSNENYGIGDIELDKVFSNYSFSKSSFTKKIEDNFKIALPLKLLWEYPTIELIAKHICDTLNHINHRQHSSSFKQKKHQAIAIVGMGCRFPGGVNNPQQLWELLVNAKNPITQTPIERNKLCNTDTQEFAGFIDDIDKFDERFFEVNAQEAKLMDPQQRIFLEVAYQALENAAISSTTLAGTRTGVFVGASMHDYERLLIKNKIPISAYSNIGNATSAIAARLSYFLGTNGPSFTTDTACSSSLTAIAQACHAIAHGDCTMAIAGGINLILDPEQTTGFKRAGMLAPDGRCKTFDEKADGYVRSEGCGVLVLKKLTAARRDNDNILAVIKSAVINQDGMSNGLTAPNVFSQQQLLSDALGCAGLSSEQIDFFETHGTGTYIGDPIELDAINSVYANSQRKKPLILGALKSQLGHCEAAAGVAGVIKTVLSMQYNQITANHHLHCLNKSIDINGVPCEIPTSNIDWKMKTKKRAAVSSFSFSGTNAHLILEAPSKQRRRKDSQTSGQHIFMLSAKSEHALQSLINVYIDYLANNEVSIDDLCFTLAIGRAHYKHRIAFIARDIKNIISTLKLHPKVKAVNNSLVEQYLSGLEIDWQQFYKPYQASLQRIIIPGYCFERNSHWFTTQQLANKNWLSILKNTPEYQREQIVIKNINSLIVEALNLDKSQVLDPDKKFFEMGVSSLMAIELTHEIEKQLGNGCSIRNTLFFDYSNMRRLTNYLVREVLPELFHEEP